MNRRAGCLKGACPDLWGAGEGDFPRLPDREFETGSQARQALGDWFRFYNEQRPHTAFDGRRPMDVYRDGHSASKAA
ncbi:MAG: integrase core domain-containing protein [Solidesulfovibrio sp. DCME]|uniref:integrase core domain-containing protein n=1 Tax=Solidesulfovibrio sp. DCME TaxID=3447380 RepID=UPI003D11C082